MDLKKLCEPFDPDRISWRVGSTSGDKKRGMALAYIDARDVMQRLDDVCGTENWQCRYSHADKKTVCEIAINIPGNCWVWKADGAGDTDFEADKGALSDAFKRAAVRWGIGRYLYDVDAPWVHIEPMGKSYKIKDDELKRLNAILKGHNPPAPPPVNSRDPSWQGPLNKVDLMAKAREVAAEIASCTDTDQLDVYMDSPPVKAIVTQMKHDAPDWWDRVKGPKNDFEGLKQRYEYKRRELQEKTA
jgi:hypothetical protein